MMYLKVTDSLRLIDKSRLWPDDDTPCNLHQTGNIKYRLCGPTLYYGASSW
ncbi:hypothetical protein RSAG8_12923, partial [Rhizoctonia solani AG-8 WAC10335]